MNYLILAFCVRMMQEEYSSSPVEDEGDDHFKGELTSADELRKTVSQKGKEDFALNSKNASDNAGLVNGTQEDAVVAGQY